MSVEKFELNDMDFEKIWFKNSSSTNSGLESRTLEILLIRFFLELYPKNGAGRKMSPCSHIRCLSPLSVF